ncbi:flagellar motor switch phosphatase FliY [Caproiciproducens galactitolivorans]|uniref:Flagellar motor switch protein FliN n=1 Tax=Caproiciproducens galactitolivorans TaxID=642589 RepID=A0A4Z0YG80_9FIRM|nr:flagellar motor switch phosphatase FliY [Caproiciproducens galactitolivorans]QEY34333.1 flagellar motor switch phosphatase FliY [Caproiciproducens galactitolivorans]TGJ77900.1 flagellar motor switch protein FliN [Caproiciproducens galactitolivorans]
MEPNNEEIFSAMDIDAIGEILNISLGSSATSVSEMLEQRVNITTPRVEVMPSKDVHFESMEPAIAVEINYVSGLDGKNILILKESDVKVIVGLLLHTDYSEQEFVMDEMSIGAICEVMNMMMGASATALSQFLNMAINISPPTSFPINDSEQFKSKYFETEENVVTVHFNLMIGDMVNSEFISLMKADLAKELIRSFNFGAPAAAEQPAEEPVPPKPQPAPSKPQPAPSKPQPVQQQKPAPVASKPAPVVEAVSSYEQPQNYNVGHVAYQSFDAEDTVLTNDQNNNLNMIMSVPLQITVEIGRTQKPIKDILDFTSGTIIELDKQAGSQVDVFVNGKRIAKGDVVVVDDFYGVRITEVLSNSEIMKLI